MSKSSFLKRNVVILVVAGLVLGVGAFAWAKGSPPRPTTGSPDVSSSRRHRCIPSRPALARVIHGDLIVRRRSGFENVTVDRGDVARHSATSITVTRPDGVEVTKSVDGDTRFRGIDSIDKVVDGRFAVVVSKADAAVFVAQRSGDTPDRPCRRAPGNFRDRTTVDGVGEQVPAT